MLDSGVKSEIDIHDYKDNIDIDLKIEYIIQLLESISSQNNEILKKLNKIDTFSKQVKKSAGRKTCKMYYENKEVQDKDIKYLIEFMGLNMTQILDHFKYVNTHGTLITDREKCRMFLNNRLRRE